MKRIIYIISFFCIFWVLNIDAHAELDSLSLQLKQTIIDDFSVSSDKIPDAFLTCVSTVWKEYPSKQMGMTLSYGYEPQLTVMLGDSVYVSGGMLYYSNWRNINFNTNNGSWSDRGNFESGTSSSSTGRKTQTYGDLATYHPVTYTYTYNPALPVPNFKVYWPDTIATSTDVPGHIKLNPFSNYDEFYLQFKIRFYSPSDIYLDVKNGFANYTVQDYNQSDFFEIEGFEDLFLPINSGNTNVILLMDSDDFVQGWNGSQILTEWVDFIESQDEPNYTSNVGLTSNSFLRNKNLLESYRKNAQLVGNRVEFLCRYYIVENEGDIYYGDWARWYSVNPDVIDVTSGLQYTPESEISNNTSTVTPEGGEIIESDTQAPSNVATNPNNVVVTVNNSYVPNNQQYPTVASYNQDNVLVQFITTAKNLPSFFGDFTVFLTSAFGFIPAVVWDIIGFGFLCCIVIMIIKVL